MERRQAEAVAETAALAAASGHGELATRGATKGDIKDLRKDLATAMDRLEARVYLALVGVVFAILAADRLLP